MTEALPETTAETTKTELDNIRRLSALYLIVAVLVSGLMLLFANALANGGINQVKQAKYTSCLARNKANVAAAANDRSQYGPMLLSAKAQTPPDPVLVELLGALASTKASVVVCTQ